MVLDHSKIFQNAKCNMNQGQRNYNICFSVFSGLMFLALVTASQIPFRYQGKPDTAQNSMPMGNMNQSKKPEESPKEKLKKA